MNTPVPAAQTLSLHPFSAPLGALMTPTTNAAKPPVEAPTPSHTPAPTPTPGGTPATSNEAVKSVPATTSATTQDSNKSSGGILQQLGGILPIVLIFVVLYFLLFRGQRKEKDQQKKMLEALKKGDKVMTIGGMIGSVVDIRGDEVVLKVDEANNTKARYVKSAIQKVLDTDTKVEDKK